MSDVPSAEMTERILSVLRAANEPLSRTALANLVPGKRAAKFSAISYLIDEGFIAAEGEGRRMRLSIAAEFPAVEPEGNQTTAGTASDDLEGTEGTDFDVEAVVMDVVKVVRWLQGSVVALTDRVELLERELRNAVAPKPKPTSEEISTALAQIVRAAR